MALPRATACRMQFMLAHEDWRFFIGQPVAAVDAVNMAYAVSSLLTGSCVLVVWQNAW